MFNCRSMEVEVWLKIVYRFGSFLRCLCLRVRVGYGVGVEVDVDVEVEVEVVMKLEEGLGAG